MLLNLFFPFITQALAADDTENKLRNAGNIGNYITILYNWVIPFAGGLGVLVLIYAGYLYVTSQGNPDSINRAKELIIGALTGLALIILSGIILKNFIGTP